MLENDTKYMFNALRPPPPNRYAGTIFNKHPGNLTLVRPSLTFHKRGLPGQFPGCFWPFFGRTARTWRDPGQVQSIFFTPRGPWVTFNSSLKVIRAPATNIPRFKPVNCPAWGRRGPCRDPPGTRGQFLKKSTQDTRPSPLRDPGGSLWGPDLSMFNQSINPFINQSINLGYYSFYRLFL